MIYGHSPFPTGDTFLSLLYLPGPFPLFSVFSGVSYIFLDGAQPVLCIETLFQRNLCRLHHLSKQCADHAPPSGDAGSRLSQPELFCLFATYTTRMLAFGCTYLSAQGSCYEVDVL